MLEKNSSLSQADERYRFARQNGFDHDSLWPRLRNEVVVELAAILREVTLFRNESAYPRRLIRFG